MFLQEGISNNKVYFKVLLALKEPGVHKKKIQSP